MTLASQMDQYNTDSPSRVKRKKKEYHTGCKGNNKQSPKTNKLIQNELQLLARGEIRPDLLVHQLPPVLARIPWLVSVFHTFSVVRYISSIQ